MTIHQAPLGARPAVQARSLRTVERLFAAADTVFAVKGFAAASVGEICRTAGVSVGAFYGRFEDKSAFLKAFFERSLASAAPAIDLERKAPAAARLRAYVQGRVSRLRAQAPVLRAAQAHRLRSGGEPGLRPMAADPGVEDLRALIGPDLRATGRTGLGRNIRMAAWIIEAGAVNAVVDEGGRRLRLDDDGLIDGITRAALGVLGLPTEDGPAGEA
jgi:AcrR family transcriptional regulator